MKGFVKVLNENITSAINNHKSLIQQITLIKDAATLKHYERYYKGGSILTKFLHKSDTPDKFLRERLGKWEFSTDRLLNEFMSSEEVKICNIPNYGDKAKREELEALVSCTYESYCTLGEGYCEYVDKYIAL